MARKGYLTAEGAARAKPRANDRWLTDQDGRRGGQLVLRITPNGAKSFFFRYTTPEGGRVSLPLGPFTVDAKSGALTLEQARQKRDEYRALYREHRDLREHFQRVEDDRRDAEERERRERERDATLTLRTLMDAYITHLEAGGKKKTTGDVRSLCRLHLGDYASIPAREVTPRNVTAILRRLVESGKGRTAAKLRSYLLAAYTLAVKADRDPTVPSAFLPFGLESNPVETTDPLAQFNKARDRVLSQAELAAFWKRLDGVKSEPVRAALRLALLLGGQRPTQLLRLERGDVDLQAGVLRLLDPKGRRNAPRVHELPIADAAAAVLAAMLERSKTFGCAWIFTTDGEHTVQPETVTVEVRNVSAAMFVAGEAKSEFQLRDLRRTCETQLAAMGVSRDLRARLLSHGLTGVQHKHYDRHDYRAELRAVLERWTQRLHGTEAVVVPFGKAAA